tara:strand:- start:10 stop:498 length:489 start_codon:yes stop_codon:yes gene_type:complete
MIITCNNCSKKFELDSSLIPEKGRLLECNACQHRWFFKREVINKTTVPAEVNSSSEKLVTKKVKTPKNIELLDKDIKEDFVLEEVLNNKDSDKDLEIISPKIKKKYNILGLIIVLIISFIALIIVLDTFQNPINKIIPNIEFILYNLYETINDITLFLKDLI